LGEPLLHVFTDQQDVISASLDYLWWMVLLPVAGFACYIWDGVFIGLTASRAMRDTMIIALVVFLALYYLWFVQYGNHGLWLGLTVFLLARGIIQWVWFRLKGVEIS
jgi:MATE family multidrug resistance protein